MYIDVCICIDHFYACIYTYSYNYINMHIGVHNFGVHVHHALRGIRSASL